MSRASGLRGPTFLAVANSGVQVQHAGDVFRVDDLEIQDVVHPVLTKPVPILSSHGQSVLLAAQETVHLELYLQCFVLFETSKVDAFQARVGSKNIHSYSVSDENSHDGVVDGMTKDGLDA